MSAIQDYYSVPDRRRLAARTEKETARLKPPRRELDAKKGYGMLCPRCDQDLLLPIKG